MAIAFDAAVESVRTGTGDPHTWTHTPVGTPRAIVVAVIHGTSATDHVSSLTYGGVAMTRPVRATDIATEPGAAELWFLGAGIPTGAQTVSADLATATTDDIQFVSMSFTGDLDCEVRNFQSLDNNRANPSVELLYNGRTCISVGALYSGLGTTTNFVPNANCTAVHDHDYGAFISRVFRQTTPGTADFTIGGTSSTDDAAFAALAITEVLGVVAASGSYVVTGTDATLPYGRVMVADSGSYAVTGTDATLSYSKPVHLKASSFIAASGTTATTARLTAPAGKTTSDFVAGKISDDTNPLPTIDITADDYTELEWCLETNATLTASNVYEFRVVESDGTVLSTYTVTPTWTIGSNAFSLTAESGSYAVTGTDAALRATIILTPDSGSYVISGTTTGLNAGYRIAIDSGSYAVTGTDATALPGFAAVAASGSYAVTGTDATLRGAATHLGMAVQPAGAVAGSPLLTQPQVHLLDVNEAVAYQGGRTITVALSPGVLGTLGGTTSQVTNSSGLAVFTDLSMSTQQSGATLVFTCTGLTEVTSASFNVTGNAVLVPDLGTYVVTGTDVAFLRGVVMVAASGSYAVTGTDATLTVGRVIALKASSHIAAGGGTATTARLTAPSGKTSGADFQAGAISDDTNPLATLNLGSGKYTELEWCIVVSATLAANSNVYEFRVVADDTVLDTYTVTPTFTVGASAYSLTADSGSYVLTGTDAGLLRGIVMTADAGSYVLTGTDVTLTGTAIIRLGASSYIAAGGATATTARLTAPSGKTSGADFQAGVISDDTNPLATIDIVDGKYTELEWSIYVATGLTPGAVYEFRVVADGAVLDTYTVTPTWTIGAASFSVTADPGSYVLTGTAAGIVGGFKITADSGSYVITGVDISIGEAYPLIAESGTYGIGGTAAALTPQAPGGVYTLTGTDANLEFGRLIAMTSGSYVVTGTDTAITRQIPLVADPGSYILTGTDAPLVYDTAGNFTIAAEPGSYAVTGVDAGLISPRTAIIESGVYLITGTATGLTATRYLVAASGSYTLTGTDSTLYPDIIDNYLMVAAAGSYAVSGRPVDMRYGGILPTPRTGTNRNPRLKPFVAGSH